MSRLQPHDDRALRSLRTARVSRAAAAALLTPVLLLSGAATAPANAQLTAQPTAQLTAQLTSVPARAATSTTTLTLAQSSALIGESVNMMAQVQLSAGTPAGAVTFTIDQVAVATIAVEPDGSAVIPSPETLALGAHTIVATFVPNDAATVSGSASAPATLTLENIPPPPVKAIYTYTNASYPKAVKFGAAVVIKPVITAQGGAVPTGQAYVTVWKINTPKKVVTVNLVGGRGTATFKGLAVGRYKATVRYRGNADFAPSRKIMRFEVRK